MITISVTLANLKFKLSDYCIDRQRTMVKNNKLISAVAFESEIINCYKDLLKKSQNVLDEEEYKWLEEFYIDYTKTFIENYKKVVVTNKTSETGYSTESGLDVDPVTLNGKTFINGKKIKVFSDYVGTNSTYSVADMVASINIETEYGFINKTLGELQTVSYSIYQQKSPVRNLGNMNAKDWVFGPRTIAGSLVFAVFNKHWLMDLYDELQEKAGMKNWHFIGDEIPPFNIILTFGNEYGFDSRMVIYGVRLMNEGQTMSTNDIYIENTYEFVASDIDVMDSLRAYEQGMARHLRGGAAIEAAKNGYIDSKIDAIPIEKDNTPKYANKKSEFNEEDYFMSDEDLSKMDKKVALKNLSDIKSGWLKLYPNDKEMRNRIKAEYNKQKDRIEKFYKKEVKKDE